MRFSWALWLVALLILTTSAARAADKRSTTSLDAGWRFQRGEVPGAAAPATDHSDWAQVTLPHSFNGADGDDGGGYYRGPGWYRRVLDLAAVPEGRRLWLQFDGAALATDLWVNGRHVGRHEGGHAAFRFDVTGVLRPGRNLIAVRSDNSRLPHVAPLGGDFTVFGGLYRHVWLVEVPELHVDLADHGGPGVSVRTLSLGDAAATVGVTVRVRNDGDRARRVPVGAAVLEAGGAAVAASSRTVRIPPGATVPVTLDLRISRPRRWNGRADPYLYTIAARVAGADEVRVPLGLRSTAFDPERGFLLNGRPYPLRGVNLFHPGRPGRGLAVTDAEIVDDIATMEEMGATALRFVHFQHPPAAYEEADRRGLIVWTEIGLNGIVDPGEPFLDNVTTQLRELIRQTRNHPSIALWGLGNEVYATTPEVTRILRAVQAVARAEDASRPTVYAHCCQADDDDKARISDVAAFNRYFGWYPGQAGDIGSWADGYRAANPERPFLVGEYGAGGSIRHQQLPPPAENRPESGWHPEQAQTAYHVANWRQLAARRYLGGSFIWVAFDLASDGRGEGDRPGINDKGLVTYDRAIRKDAYHWYRANWSAAPMVHLTDRRLDRRAEAATDLRAFTNAATAMLKVNGRSVGTVAVEDHIARWPGVALAMGANTIEVEAGGVRDRMTIIRISPSKAGASTVPSVVPARPNPPGDKPPGQ
ncbi:glycoside hydrolase family 2 [Sphingomonas spermidinifaciens]|uniref:Glycoside hydrolase family 2 n=1 Tax=Sphingomonas spermidinifaciens TaxID=1141889 RepID=A0A2A4B270_9SPHN|nr:glycoside hydrolase family 2 TIM barrel-domain containing protein [Sphingomonas spermidinifaciens]PCD01784.1 glycoside hydrolase family 2 [Sphingomonas spermidinifaciens]